MLSKMLVDFPMPWDWLRHSRSWVLIPIVLAAMAYQDAATRFNFLDQITALHAISNSAWRRAQGIAFEERS